MKTLKFSKILPATFLCLFPLICLAQAAISQTVISRSGDGNTQASSKLSANPISSTTLPPNAPAGTIGGVVFFGANDAANVVAFGADPTGRLDSTDAIQAAINAKSRVYFPPGAYTISRSLNLTNNAKGWKLYGSSGLSTSIQWKGPATEAMIDMSGSQGVAMQDMVISSFAGNPAMVGILMSRIGPGGSNEHELLRVNVIGYFTVAALYTLQSESDDFIDCQFYNHNTTGPYNYAVVRTSGIPGSPLSTPDFGVTSIYQTLQASGGNTVGFFLGDYFMSDAGTAFYCKNCYDLSMYGAYANGGVYAKPGSVQSTMAFVNSNKITISGLREEGPGSANGIYILGGMDTMIIDNATLTGFDGPSSAGIYVGDTSTVTHMHMRGSCKNSPRICSSFYDLTQSEIDTGNNATIVRGNAKQNVVHNGYNQAGAIKNWRVAGSDTGTLMDTGAMGSGNMLSYSGNFYPDSLVIGRPYYNGPLPAPVYVYAPGAMAHAFVQSGTAGPAALSCYDASTNNSNTPNARFCAGTEGTANGSGDAMIFASDATAAPKSALLLRGQYHQIVQEPALPIISGTFQSGGIIRGTSGQTCTLASFNAGGTGAIANVTLTGTNSIAAGTAFTITAPGAGFESAPTNAMLSSGTATCSGAATVQTALDNSRLPPSDIGFVLKSTIQLQGAVTTCDAAHRGVLQFVAGNPDILEVCLKDASGKFLFQQASASVAPPGTIYSAANPLPACGSAIRGALAVVGDAASPAYMAAYRSGGATTAAVICSFNGIAYSWVTH